MDDSKAGEDEMDVGDSEDAEEDEEEEEEELSSPLGDHGSLMMALASTNVLPYEGLASPLRLTTSTGKPLNLKRGRGRPAGRAESKVKKPLGLKLKRWKTGVYMPSDKSPRHSLDGDDGASDRSPAHSSEPSTPAPATPHSEDKLFAPPPPDETSPYFTETWPGKVCVLCNLSERSQLGQGEMLRLACQEGFVPQRPLSDSPGFISPSAEPEELAGPDKSPRAPALSCRRQKNWAKCRNVVLSGQEPLDELSIVGYTEEPDIVNLFENAVSQWHVYIHENCALWSLGVSRPTDADFQTIGQIVVSACMRKCSYCGRLGASVACTFNNCQRFLHHPCSAASGAFQDSKSYSLVCNLHLDQVSLMPGLGDVTCMSCFSLGDVRNLTMCSMCGNHYHGGCVGLALLPGVRAGWQCQDCRICQICRQPEDSKVMLCETCDKAYHPHCLRPVVATIPKYGWKCKCCRVCSDCGSRTPGAGQSSRWHAHYTVCDSCYQQRNKGFSCPLCRRAYRAAAYREMVQCSKCKRFVHGTCDPDADLVTYQQRKEATPEYEYVCLNCKNEPKKRKDSIDDFCMDSSMSASQESLVLDEFDFDCEKEGYGIGKGKPFCASKIAKKKLGLGYPGPGRPGKFGKMSGITSALMMNYQKKQQRFNEFGRKRMPKAKMRGIFGVPGLGLQKPQADATKDKNQDDDTSENKLVLCSAKDKFVLTQDMCVMCGALGTDQEGCLIACVQCGQCYHPYCASVKVTKVILQKGWRCLDCTVCEGCGQRNDEARLLLCDDCDISYHIYCMNPPLTYVPRGTWKCKWCAQCLTCGASEPGVNCSWLKNYTECGPCGSRNNCPSCTQTYVDGELIIKCIQCERWIHCMCDNIQTEEEAEMCAEDGYRCMMCRPKDVKLPHLLAGALNRPPSTPTRSNSPEFTKSNEGDFYMVDGVRLSENGMYQIRALTMEQQIQPRRRKPNTKRHGSSADILATIESVIAGGNTGYTADDCNDPDEDTVEEKVYREGMPVFPRADGRPPEPPEGFTIYTTESGAMVLRRKRVRNLQKLGIGGFNARLRQTRCKDREEICDGETMTEPPALMMEDKPRRKPQRRKPKSKLAENYPSYLQEAFFGRDLLDTSKTVGQDLNSSSDEGEDKVSTDKTITLSQDELKVLDQMKIKQDEQDKKTTEKPLSHKEDDSGSDAEALKDILRLPDNLLDTDLVNTIMTETDGDIKSEENLIAESTLSDDRGTSTNSSKDELSDILGPHFNLVNMVRQTGLPNMDCKDVEEIFKGVLTDESQTSTEYTQPATNLIQSGPPHSTPSVIQSRPALQHPNMSSPITFPGTSPYHPEYSNSPQFSPVFQEPQIWGEEQQVEFNQQNLLCMEADESLGPASTIAAVLYANITHPEWKKEFPSFADRFKQISKSWRNLTQEQRLPYLQQARENKMNLRIKKTQIVKETSANSAVTASSSPKGTEVCPGEGDLHNLTEPSPVPPSTPAPVHTLVSTGSNTSPPTAKFPTAATEPQTFPTTIPSHPSTIQYIPLIPTTNPQPIRATFHLIPTKPTTTSSSEIPRTVYQYERGTIHYPPTTVQIIQSVPPLIMTSGSVISATVQTNTENTTQTESSKPRNVLQIISTQRSTTTSTSPPQSSPRQIQFSVRTEASETPPRTPSNPASSSPLSDQHIRVLTPSEIMRTLPSLGQEAYDPPPSMQEQEKLQQAKTVREAEQERQWKQLQALRQQQAQQQQQMMTDQRVQATQRVRQLTTDQVVNLPAENQTQLQTQVGSPVQVARMVTPGCIGYPRFPHTAQRAINPEMSRQLRDLLQRQQIKTKLEAERPWGQDEQGIVSPGVTDPPTLLSPASNQPQGFDTTSPATFRHPLPPSLRPGARLPLTQSGMIIRTGTPRMPTALDPRIQGVDARVRLLLQQRPGFQPTQMLRLSNPRNPLDPYDHLVQRPPFPDGSNSRQPGDVSRLASTPPSDSQRLAVGGFSKASAGDSREEIPESVTAELEKLEQEEGGPGLVEVEGVNAILGDLVEDDDELLAEMGADFNILEYADPELDKVGGGEKTNIFDVEEFEEEDSKKDAVARTEKKETAAELKPGAKQTQPDTATNPVEPTGAKNLSVTPSEPQITTSTAQTTSAQPANGGLLGQPPSGVPGVSYTPSFPAAVPQQGLTRMQHVGQVVTQQQRLQQIQRLGAPRTPVPSPITLQAQPRLPPPYPGPPPPYPGPIQQGELQFGPSFRRPLLLQEQPLLLEDLLEQEKREQEKQQAGTGATTGTVTAPGTSDTPAPQTASLTALSDADFERIRADLLGTRTPQAGVSPHSITGPGLRPPYRPPGQSPQWQQAPPTPRTITPPEPALRMPLFNVMPTPPVPPEVIVTEEDRRVQLTYENWLNSQNHAVTQQLKYCETEVQKLRKLRKSLNSKQRQQRKNGNELPENDALELQRVCTEQQGLQKQLESFRKQSRQHSILIQEYKQKQQAKGRSTGTSLHSSPSGSSPQSPGGLQLSSPGPGPINSSMSPLQQSPGIATPHSQGDENPFSPGTPSPRPPAPPSTPHPAVVGSPGAGVVFSPQEQSPVRHAVLSSMSARFVRSPEAPPRPRVMLPTQYPATPRPAPPTDKLRMFTPQQQQQLLLQRQQLQQQRQVLLQQQQELNQEAGGLTVQQRQLQIAQQRQALQQQQEMLQQQMSEPNLSPQQRQQLQLQSRAVLQQMAELPDVARVAQRVVEGTEIARQHQIQLLQRQQQQQFNRQQMLLNQQGKVGQIQQFRQQNPQQSPSRSPMGQFGQTSPMPQHFSGTPTSPMPPQSPIQSQFTGSSPMHPQSPMISQHQPNSSPILPQSPMQNQSQFQQNTNSPHPKSPMVQPYSNQTPNSPIHPLSPRVQQGFTNQPQSPITTPQSPMVQSQNFHQTPNSPMTHHFNQPSSPRPPQSPRVQSQFQHPTSPMGAPQSPHIQQSQFVHRPNSPIRSPMPAMSPMPIRRPSSTGGSSQIEGQINFENPSPRMGHEQELNQGGGGGNPHLNPIPAPASLFGRCGFRKLGLRGGSPMWGSERPPPKRPLTGKVIKSDYEDELSRNSSQSTSKSPQKKTQSLESQEATSKNDDESTVYDDIVLVENETNLEVEELQSSLQGNVMTMPMVIDGGHLQVTEMNLGSENVEGVLDDCLVSSTNLGVLDVDRPGSGEETDCLLGMVDKDESESVQEDLLILEEDLAERESKEDESDVIEMMEESMSPPTGRKRLVGKVLPGESLKKLQEKRDSTTDTPDSPDQEEGNNDHSPDTYTSETDNEIVSTTFDRKTESVSTTTLDQSKEELKDKHENLKQVFPSVHPSASQIPPSSAHQANIGIPSLTRPSVSYPTYPRGVPRHVFPLTKPDGRSVIAVQQAAVANLVQDAVNAAKLVAEKKQYSQGVSVGQNLIPTLLSTPSTNSSIGIVSTTGTTLIAPPRMSVPFLSSARITTGSTSSNTHFMPILSQSGGLLKIEVINKKMETDDCEKNTQKQGISVAVSKQTSIPDIPEGFQKHLIDSVAQNLSRPEENRTKTEVSLGPHPSKAHSYSKILMSSNTMQSVKPSDVIEMKRSESTSQAIHSFGSDYSRHAGVISSKSSASGIQQSSVITQVSVINDVKAGQIEEASSGSSILEAQLTASSREDIQISRNSAVSSPSKTLFSFLDHMRDANKEPQCGSLNLSDMSVTYDDNKVHTEGLTLYRSSESIMSQSSISQMLKHQINSDVKLPVSVMTHLTDKQDESRVVCQPSIRRIGNLYVHSQNIKSEEVEPSDSNIRGQAKMFSTDPMQRQPKLESSPVIKTEIRTSSNISELFHQKQQFFEQKPVLSQQQDIEPINYSSSSTITSTKTVPTRLGELISGGTNAHAHIERRLSVAGQSDVESTKSQFRGQLQVDTLQQKAISSSDPNPSFLSGLQRDKEVTSQFIPLSSILTPKVEPSVTPRIADDSQNVLLKQLLQNTACATTSATASTTVNTVAVPQPERVQTIQPESSAVQPPPMLLPTSIKTQQTSPMLEPRRLSTDTQSSTLDELLSPSSPVIKREPLLTPAQIKREPSFPQSNSQLPQPMASPLPKNSPVMVEVKKEVVSSDEMISPGIRSMDPMETGSMDHSSNMPLDPQDLKKLKRRQYQQKRRQSQGKDGLTPKKRPRKSSKVEEDYDSFIDSLMAQLRQTPAMVVLEPSLGGNYMVCPIFGAGDLGKVHLNSRTGELKGSYGNATMSESDHYNTVPYGEQLPLPPQATPSTQRGFYNEEFSPLRLDTCKDDFDDRKHEFNRERETDTPDTIVSSSSPELVVPEPFIRYPGLRLIDDDSEDEERVYRRSPVIPIVIPTAIKPKDKLSSEMDKENAFRDNSLIKTRLSPSIPLKDSANVTVTLTLTSAAADDVLGVLRNLANVLRIPAPTAYHITERTVTPPSHKLGLYRTKGKDGKEGAPVDIQSILNGEAKFCRHCDVIILNNLIRKKASEMPFLTREESTEDLYFCSTVCYMQLALTHHSPAISQDKAAAVVDHLSQSDPSPVKKSKFSIDAGVKKKMKLEIKEEPTAKLEVNLQIVKKEEPSVVMKEKPKLKGVKYRVWTSNTVPPPMAKHKRLTDKEMTETLFRMGITVMPAKLPDDTRTCLFCHQVGDGVADGPARLLNYDVDKWVHLNCALWSDEVYETVNGALMNVETVLQQSLTANCCLCGRAGATLKCYKLRCSVMYHLPCAVKDQCVFYKNKTLYCNLHVPKNEKDNELTTLAVFRRVYVNRDENRQVASVMHHTEHNNVMRVGSMILLNIGQLLPHQLAAFHSQNYIYPIGYKIVRFYWSMRVSNKRCRYICSIHEANGRPEFRVLIQEPQQEDIELRDISARAVWVRVLEPLAALRKASSSVQVFPRFVSGEDLFGLTEPAIVRVLESLPGVETLTDYRFKYGRNPLLELPLAINPSGCARCEPKPRGQEKWKRAHTQRTTSAHQRTNCVAASSALGEAFSPYSKQFVHSKSSQYKKMKQEWRNNVYLARSKIQGLGLYAARDLDKHTMVIEYIGELIRTELAESREKQYEAKNRGIYMFRLDEERVVDATLSGGLARYINHSCNPNCVAETVEVERDVRIIIFAKRRISRGEELAYDYKFDIEDDQHKIPCMCGAPNCRKWMN